MQDFREVTDKVELKNLQQVLKEDRAVFLDGGHKNSKINVSFQFSFSEITVFFPEDKSKLIIKLLLLKCAFFSCCENEEIGRCVFFF